MTNFRWLAVALVPVAALVSAMASTGPAGAQQAHTLSWLSTGDSYSAGEGVATVVPQGVPTLVPGQIYYPRDQECAQSPLAWGPAAATRLKDEFQYTIEPLVFSACTGRLTSDFFTRYHLKVPFTDLDNPLAERTSLYEWTKDQGAPTGNRYDIVTMSFGGNDIGFGDAIKDCLLGPNFLKPRTWSDLIDQEPGTVRLATRFSCDISEEELNKRVDRLASDVPFDSGPPSGIAPTTGSLSDFYTSVLNNLVTERGHIIVLGYPHLFASSGDWESWRTRCWGTTDLDVKMLNRVSDRLNSTILAEVKQADPGQKRIQFLPVAPAFRPGHELCGKAPWLNGFTSQRQFNASFHPNAQGYAEEATLASDLVRALPWPVPAVDWNNTSYITDCAGVSEGQPFQVIVRNRGGTGVPNGPQQFEITVAGTASGDLRGDGRLVTAVLLRCTPMPSNYFTTEVQMLTEDQKQIAVLRPPNLHPEGALGPEFSEQPFTVEGHILHTGADYYGLGDCHAGGPSVHHDLDWTWNTNSFISRAGPAVPGPGTHCRDPAELQTTLTPEATAIGLFTAWQNHDRLAAEKYASADVIRSLFNYDPAVHGPATSVPTCEPSGIPISTNCNFEFITMTLPNTLPGNWWVTDVSVNDD